ncbi:MAG TPA: DoxX family protein [Gemmatimonadaceae bacterium]|jgi:putative oxidoreductase|nr:DoxX family protein [Gemmatimonadaceae bacterium]
MTENNVRRVNLALLVLRLIAGGIMIAHGAQKLFVFGMANVGANFGKMGIPAPGVMGPFIGLLEFLAPIAIIIGLLTRLAALGLAFDMLGAIAFVHFKNGFFAPMGLEYPLALLGMYAALVIAGAGDYSIDGSIARRKTEVVG